MAYRSRRSSGRRSYARPARRSTRRVTRKTTRRRSTARAQTIRIVVEQPQATLARPAVGTMVAPTAHKAMF